MSTIQNLTHSLSAVAEHFKVNEIDVKRWAALGFITVDTVDGKKYVSHDSLVAAIPRLSGVPMGIKRDKVWFDKAAIPSGKRRLAGEIKVASENQLLSSGEVAARSNERTNSLGITLQFTDEIKAAVDAPWISGFQSKIKSSIGKKDGYWQPSTVREAYIAEYLLKALESKTGHNLNALYESKTAFESLVKLATDKLLSDSIQFIDNVPAITGRLRNPPAVIYSIASNVLFNRAGVTFIASQIF